MSLPIRPELLAASAYGAPQIDVPIKLNTNENPFPLPAALVAEITREIGATAAGLNRYPDRDFRQLRAGLAEYLTQEAGCAVAPEQIWAANGSNEVMQQLFQTVGGPGRKALVFSPTYSMYEEYARNTFTDFVSVPRRADFGYDPAAVAAAISAHDPTIIIFTSPNNPTGTAIEDQGLLEAALRAAPDSLVIVDEAYAEFRRPGVPSALPLLERYPNLVVVRTMSKAFAMAGLRLGYAAMSPELLSAVMRVRLPYHLSTSTQVIALAALRHAAALQAELDLLRSERDSLVTWLRDNGFEVADSDTNFVLFGQFPDRHATWQALVDQGVLIREVGPAGWLRVTIGTPDEMTIFKKTLLQVEGNRA